MKKRGEYVSNSSSTSFMVCYNSLEDFSCLSDVNRIKYYETFMNDVKDKKNHDSTGVYDFLVHLCDDIVHDYKWDIDENDRKKKGQTWGSPTEDSILRDDAIRRFSSVMDRLQSDNTLLMSYAESILNLVDKYNENEYDSFYDEIAYLERIFAKVAFDELRKHFAYASCFEYSDNDGEHWSYMEHEYMYNVLGNEEEGNYGAFSINNH